METEYWSGHPRIQCDHINLEIVYVPSQQSPSPWWGVKRSPQFVDIVSHYCCSMFTFARSPQESRGQCEAGTWLLTARVLSGFSAVGKTNSCSTASFAAHLYDKTAHCDCSGYNIDHKANIRTKQLHYTDTYSPRLSTSFLFSL